jgi:transposase
MPSPKLEPLVLSAQERQVLEGWARQRKTSQALAVRSRIVLACADGASVTAVAADLKVSRGYRAQVAGPVPGLAAGGLGDEPRPGAPRTITDEQVELVITKTLEERGPGVDTHWSTRSMAAATGMSQSAISRIWRAFGLKPHLTGTWKLSADPQFIDKVRDIVGLYLDPPEKALVLAVDEKSQIQGHRPDRAGPATHAGNPGESPGTGDGPSPGWWGAWIHREGWHGRQRACPGSRETP